ncbi:hypothetical protein PILCRDRAFT_814666 [Piloderma croceum F 1598]|uniref:SET domain-containing protein n=1 Tax=Piloderma croceum (strain F 1598) TaxID=765440 RepID=A0A0C3CE42_PILCF|nr:hypothetical protein PILCRDRAFT_814666 [Piloderma croceum F 1598]
MVEKFIYTTGSMPADGHQPSHPGILSVKFRAGDFQSELVAEKTFKRGDVICKFDKYRPGERRTRTSIQLGEAEHCELNTDLVFANHSCDPNTAFDISSADRTAWKVVALKDIAVGDVITFFYPITEWDAWGGGFECACGTTACIGSYGGAVKLSQDTLGKYEYVNPHIYRLAKKRDMA